MSTAGTAPRAAPISNARAEASRRNGARSKGPKTAEGKARSSQNAIQHGLRARKWVVLHGESEAEFRRLEAAVIEELAPEGVLQSLLAQRVAAAAWRLGRAEQIETQLFAENSVGGGSRSLGLAWIRDGNDARSFDTLMRYRGGTLAEFYRSLRTLKALQAERAIQLRKDAAEAPAPTTSPPAVVPLSAPAAVPMQQPDEPERPKNPGDWNRPTDRANPNGHPSRPAPASLPPALPVPAEATACARPFEPETRKQPAGVTPPAMANEIVGRASLLAGTTLGSDSLAAAPGRWLGRASSSTPTR